MKRLIFILVTIIPYCISAQTYIIKTQGSNNSAGGAFVAPVVSKTYTLPAASSNGTGYNSNSSSTSYGQGYRMDNTKKIETRNSSSSELYTPKQSVADAAKNFKCISGDCKNGIGTYQGSPTTTYKYVGGFKNGKYNGKGTIYDWEGYIHCEGNFVNGVAEGQGKKTDYREEIVFGDGSITRYNTAVNSVYEGGFKQGRFDGKGYYVTYTDFQTLKNIYSGDFVDDKMSGEGVLLNFAKDKISSYYSGGWNDNDYEGIGIDSSEKGIYIGDFAGGERNGQGTSYWSVYTTGKETPVMQYAGTWKRDYKDGTGTEYDKKGKILYEGDFAADLREGKGKLYKEDGSVVEGIWVKGINKEAGEEKPSAATTNKSFEENFKDNQNLWLHNSPYCVATVEKGVYHIDCAGGYKDYNNFTIDIPGGVSFESTDDWSLEVTGRSGNKHGMGSYFGIGWDRAEFTVSPVADDVYFHYDIVGFDKYKGNRSSTKVKKGFNTLTVVKKADLLEAFVNGNKVFSGAAGNLSSNKLTLVMEKQDPAYGPFVEFKKVVFKKLN